MAPRMLCNKTPQPKANNKRLFPTLMPASQLGLRLVPGGGLSELSSTRGVSLGSAPRLSSSVDWRPSEACCHDETYVRKEAQPCPISIFRSSHAANTPRAKTSREAKTEAVAGRSAFAHLEAVAKVYSC